MTHTKYRLWKNIRRSLPKKGLYNRILRLTRRVLIHSSQYDSYNVTRPISSSVLIKKGISANYEEKLIIK